MGTKNSYTGGGGAAGRKLRNEVTEWLDSLPSGPPDTPPSDDSKPPPDPERPEVPDSEQPEVPVLPQEAILPVIGLFRPSSSGSSDGPGGMGGAGAGRGAAGRAATGGGGGARRSAARSAATAGRAAAAAYALRTGDAATLAELGLDYGTLRALDDPIEVTRQIVAAACGPLSDGTIEDDEQRIVAAEVAQWVLEENEGGAPPDPTEIVRVAIAHVIFEAATNETAARLREGDRPLRATREAERQIRETAEALAARAELSPDGPTAVEFARAIEQGIEALREIWGGG